MTRWIFFAICFLSATLISNDPQNNLRFIIWNIGQGQWTTLISENYCDHFDIGGEFDLSRKVIRICANRKHRVHLSHWDWDHMGLLQKIRQKGIKPCLWNRPLGKSSARKESLLSGLTACSGDNKIPFQKIYSGDKGPKASTNESSQVVLAHQILIPGDSPKKEELKWANQSLLSNTKGLILGHHGSRSSTSLYLLKHLPKLQWAIATARYKRYKHPHPEVIGRLQKNKTPILKTEDWGSIEFIL